MFLQNNELQPAQKIAEEEKVYIENNAVVGYEQSQTFNGSHSVTEIIVRTGKVADQTVPIGEFVAVEKDQDKAIEAIRRGRVFGEKKGQIIKALAKLEAKEKSKDSSGKGKL